MLFSPRFGSSVLRCVTPPLNALPSPSLLHSPSAPIFSTSRSRCWSRSPAPYMVADAMKLTRTVPVITRSEVRKLVENRTSSIERARKDLGYEPRFVGGGRDGGCGRSRESTGRGCSARWGTRCGCTG